MKTPAPCFVCFEPSSLPSGRPSERGPTSRWRTSRCASSWPRCAGKSRRPQARFADQLFWRWLHRFWGRWQEALILVQPETVIRWHRRGFRRYWTWRSRRRGLGRPGIDRKVRELIEEIATANPLWGAPRVHAELLKLGITISQRTVSRWMPRREKPPSPTWRSFLENHVTDLVSVDFFMVPTATFQVLFGFLVLAHDRRRVVHFNVTANPTAQWTAQQVVDAFPWESAPRYLLRDRDSIFGGRCSGAGCVGWASRRCSSRIGHRGRTRSPRD